jgi:cytochrome P450
MCVGRHIAMIEICKMFPAIMRKFRFELAEPEKEWEILNYTFLKPRAINVWVVARE